EHDASDIVRKYADGSELPKHEPPAPRATSVDQRHAVVHEREHLTPYGSKLIHPGRDLNGHSRNLQWASTLSTKDGAWRTSAVSRLSAPDCFAPQPLLVPASRGREMSRGASAGSARRWSGRA